MAALCCALPLDEKDKLSLPSSVALSDSAQLKPLQDTSNIQKIQPAAIPQHKRAVEHDVKDGLDHSGHDHTQIAHDEHQTQPQTAPLSPAEVKHKREAPKADANKPVLASQPTPQANGQQIKTNIQQNNPASNAQYGRQEAPKQISANLPSSNQQKQVPAPNNNNKQTDQVTKIQQSAQPIGQAQRTRREAPKVETPAKTGPIVQQVPNQQKASPVNVPATQVNGQNGKREAPKPVAASQPSNNQQKQVPSQNSQPISQAAHKTKREAPKVVANQQPSVNQQKQVPTPANAPQIKVNGQQINSQNNKREAPKPVAPSQPLNNQQKQVPTPNTQNVKSGSPNQQQSAQPISQVGKKSKREAPKPIAASQPTNNQQKVQNNGQQIKSNNQQNKPAVNAQQTQKNPAVNAQNTKTGPTNPQQSAQPIKKTKREAPKVELQKPVAASLPTSVQQKEGPTPNNARPVGQSNGQQHRRDVAKPAEQPKPATANIAANKPKLAVADTHPLAQNPSRTRRDAPQPAIQKPLSISQNDNLRDSYDDQKPPSYVHPVPVADVLKSRNTPSIQSSNENQ